MIGIKLKFPPQQAGRKVHELYFLIYLEGNAVIDDGDLHERYMKIARTEAVFMRVDLQNPPLV